MFNEYYIIPLRRVPLAPAPRKNRSTGVNPINKSSQSDCKGLQSQSTLDWLISHVSGKIAPRV